MRSRGFMWFSLWGALSLVFPLGAGGDSGGIQRILIEGNRRLPEETILSWIAIRPGDPFDREQLQREFRSLWNRHVFSEITIESRETEEGVVIIFHLREQPVLSNVSYEGLKSISVTQVEDTLKQVHASLPIGSPISHSRIQKAQEVIHSLLREGGRRNPMVQYEVKPVSVSQHELRFQIQEGPKTKIRHLVFEENRAFSSRKLRKAFRFTGPHRFFKIFSRKDTLHESRLRSDLGRLKRLYESNGYLDIRILEERIEELGKKVEDPGSHRKKKKPKKKEWVRITIPVREGSQYRVGKLRVQGNTVFTDEEVVSRIPLKEGDIFNDAALGGGLSRLDLDYGERGYFYVTTNKILERQPDGTADVLVDIEEDERYYVNRIEFRGNTSTRDSVLRREFRLHEEELFNIRRFRTGLRRINQLGYWQLTEEPVIRPLPEERKVDILIQGKEESRNEIQIGGGVSGVDGAFFTGSYATSNFLGRGEIFQAYLQAGGRRDLFNFSFIEPYFLGTDVTLGFSLFRRETDFIGFERRGTGASVQLGRRFRDFARFDVTYLFEEIGFEQTGQSEVTSTTSSVIPVFTLDTRNNFFQPTRGFRFRLSNEVAGGFLGGDNYFIKPIVTTTLYLPSVKKTYIGLNVEVGYVKPFGTINGLDRTVPLFERFFLGGDRSLRAFQTRSVSPIRVVDIPSIDLDNDNNFFEEDLNGNGLLDTEDTNGNGTLDPGEDLNGNGALDTEDLDGDGRLDLVLPGFQQVTSPGGNKFLLLNGEYVFPLGNSVELALFVDAGNAFDDDRSFSLRNLRMDYGLEARFYLPVFQAPLRLIYAIIQDPRVGEDRANFQFSIGRTF